MNIVPKWPKKVQFLIGLTFPLIDQLVVRKPFIGGRIGYDKQLLFFCLLIKKSLGWDYRTIADMAGLSHTTLVRANDRFSKAGVYQKFLIYLIKKAYQAGLIKGEKVAMDASFVKTYSGKQEDGSLGFNDYKDSFGFKLHALIDAETGILIALIVKDGLTHESQIAIPLLKKARPWLKKCGYVLADKGYDDSEIVEYIAKALKAKASIPIKETNQRGSKRRQQLSAEERIKGGYLNWKLKSKGRSLKKTIYNKRTEVERFFSTLKRTFHLGEEKTRGIKAFLDNTYLACICFMLRRLKLAGVV
jgi:transposase